MTLRQGDLLLYQTVDGGEISVKNGEPVMDGGFQTAMYMSIAAQDNTPTWMNEYLTGAQQLKSEFLPFLKGAPKTSQNILKAEELAKKDLQWFIDTGKADEVNVNIISVDANRISVTIQILKDGETIDENEFKINWGFEKDDPANLRI